MKPLKLSYIKTIITSSVNDNINLNLYNEVISSFKAVPAMILPAISHLLADTKNQYSLTSNSEKLISELLKLPVIQTYDYQLTVVKTLLDSSFGLTTHLGSLYNVLFELFYTYSKSKEGINPELRPFFEDFVKKNFVKDVPTTFSYLSQKDSISLIDKIKEHPFYHDNILNDYGDIEELSIAYFFFADETDEQLLPTILEAVIRFINLADKNLSNSVLKGLLYLKNKGYFIPGTEAFNDFISELTFDGLACSLDNYSVYDTLTEISRVCPLSNDFSTAFTQFSLKNSQEDDSPLNPYSFAMRDGINNLVPTLNLFMSFFEENKTQIDHRTFKTPLYTPKDEDEESTLIDFYLSLDGINDISNLISHTHLSVESLDKIVEYDNHGLIFDILNTYPSLPYHILDQLANHCNNSVRRAIAFRNDTPVDIEKRLKSIIKESDNQSHNNHYTGEAFKVLSKLKGAHNVFFLEYGYDLFALKRVESPKKITHYLLNSKHIEEVRFLFESGNARSLSGLSSLQGFFTNMKGKLDRDSYLKMLKKINDAVIEKPYRTAKQTLFAVDLDTLRTAFEFFSFDELAFIMNNNPEDEARDILRMTHSLISSDDPEETAKQSKLVRRWVEKEKSLSYAFHTYLSNKSTRDLSASTLLEPLYQCCEALTQTSFPLPEGVKLIVPQSASELRELGRNQSHCVGSKYYADQCRQGSSIIFALVNNNQRTSTFTFQMNRSGALTQSKGYANTSVGDSFLSLGHKVGNCILDVLRKRDEVTASSEL